MTSVSGSPAGTSAMTLANDRRVRVRPLTGGDGAASLDATQPQATCAEWEARVVNLSPGGLGLLMPQSVEAGSSLIVQSLTDAGPRHMLTVQVVQSTARDRATWQVHCSFKKEGNATYQGPERRGAPRQLCVPGSPIHIIARPAFQTLNAYLHDISTTGIGLLLERSFDVGTVLAIQLRSQHISVSTILSAKVRHVLKQPTGGWLLGCSVSRALSAEEVQAIL